MDGSDLTLSTVIRLDSSGLHEEVRNIYLVISLDEHDIGFHEEVR